MPLNLPIDCYGCGKKLLVVHVLLCPKGGLVLEWHNDSAKEWGDLSAQALNPSDISYEPRINISTVQREKNGARSRIAMESQERQ